MTQRLRQLGRGLAVVAFLTLGSTALTSPAGAQDAPPDDVTVTGACGGGVEYRKASTNHCWGAGVAKAEYVAYDGVNVRFEVADHQYDHTGWGTKANVNIYNRWGDWLGWGACGTTTLQICNVHISNQGEGYPHHAYLDVCTAYLGGANHWCPTGGSVWFKIE